MSGIRIAFDGRGRYRVATGIRFLDHMLELVARHGAFDLVVDARGDLDVDQHHMVEDRGIALGQAVDKALGAPGAIQRAGLFRHADGRIAGRRRDPPFGLGARRGGPADPAGVCRAIWRPSPWTTSSGVRARAPGERASQGDVRYAPATHQVEAKF